jgi:hypothetical protein
MTVLVESCWGDKLYFRITLPPEAHSRANREFVVGDTWNRRTATEALDLLENVYGLKRANIRFKVV